MYDIISVGSATIDVFVRTAQKGVHHAIFNREHDVCYPIGGKILIQDLHFDTGGAGTNTAVAFARLGLKTGYLGKLGTDLHSHHIKNILAKEHVTCLGNTGKGMTGYSVILTGLEHDRTILAYKGINDTLRTNDLPWKKINTRWFYFGSMMNTSYQTLCKIAAHARKNHTPYAFNPSTYLARKGFQHLRPILHGCSVLILNKEEARFLTHANTIPSMLSRLKKHIPTVIITDGKKGAYAASGTLRYFVQPRAIRVVETTGAGDAFAAGVVYALSKHQSLPSALKTGQAEAESVIQHTGAKQGLLTRTQLSSATKRIRVEVW